MSCYFDNRKVIDFNDSIRNITNNIDMIAINCRFSFLIFKQYNLIGSNEKSFPNLSIFRFEWVASQCSANLNTLTGLKIFISKSVNGMNGTTNEINVIITIYDMLCSVYLLRISIRRVKCFYAQTTYSRFFELKRIDSQRSHKFHLI